LHLATKKQTKRDPPMSKAQLIMIATLCAPLLAGLAFAEEPRRFPVDHGWDRPILIHPENSWFEDFRKRHGHAPPHDAIIKLQQPTKAAIQNRLPCDGSPAPEFRA
jgi:hypothetical protein